MTQKIKKSKSLKKYPFKDFDKDGVPNIFDCSPLDSKKQDIVQAFTSLQSRYIKIRSKTYELRFVTQSKKRIKEIKKTFGDRVKIKKEGNSYYVYSLV